MIINFLAILDKLNEEDKDEWYKRQIFTMPLDHPDYGKPFRKLFFSWNEGSDGDFDLTKMDMCNFKNITFSSSDDYSDVTLEFTNCWLQLPEYNEGRFMTLLIKEIIKGK